MLSHTACARNYINLLIGDNWMFAFIWLFFVLCVFVFEAESQVAQAGFIFNITAKDEELELLVLQPPPSKCGDHRPAPQSPLDVDVLSGIFCVISHPVNNFLQDIFLSQRLKLSLYCRF